MGRGTCQGFFLAAPSSTTHFTDPRDAKMAASRLGMSNGRKNFAPPCLPDTQTQNNRSSQHTWQILYSFALAFSFYTST